MIMYLENIYAISSRVRNSCKITIITKYKNRKSCTGSSIVNFVNYYIKTVYYKALELEGDSDKNTN